MQAPLKSDRNGLMERLRAALIRPRAALMAVFLAAPGLPALLVGCAEFQTLINTKPSLQFEKAELRGFSLEHIDLRLHTVINNPYPVRLPSSELKLNMDIEGSKLANVSSPDLGLPARGSKAAAFDIKLRYEDLIAIYKKLPGRESLGLKLNGNLAIPLPESIRGKPAPGGAAASGGIASVIPEKLSFNFQGERNIPAVLPSIEIRNFRMVQPSLNDIKSAGSGDSSLVDKATSYLDKLLKPGGYAPGSASSAGLANLDLEIKTEFDLVMKNKAAARVLFQALNYSLFLDDAKFLAGDSSSIKNQGTESIVTVRTAFPIRSVTSSVAGIIKGRAANYRLLGKADVGIPAIGGDALKYDFDQKGRFNW